MKRSGSHSRPRSSVPSHRSSRRTARSSARGDGRRTNKSSTSTSPSTERQQSNNAGRQPLLDSLMQEYRDGVKLIEEKTKQQQSKSKPVTPAKQKQQDDQRGTDHDISPHSTPTSSSTTHTSTRSKSQHHQRSLNDTNRQTSQRDSAVSSSRQQLPITVALDDESSAAAVASARSQQQQREAPAPSRANDNSDEPIKDATDLSRINSTQSSVFDTHRSAAHVSTHESQAPTASNTSRQHLQHNMPSLNVDYAYAVNTPLPDTDHSHSTVAEARAQPPHEADAVPPSPSSDISVHSSVSQREIHHHAMIEQENEAKHHDTSADAVAQAVQKSLSHINRLHQLMAEDNNSIAKSHTTSQNSSVHVSPRHPSQQAASRRSSAATTSRDQQQAMWQPASVSHPSRTHSVDTRASLSQPMPNQNSVVVRSSHRSRIQSSADSIDMSAIRDPQLVAFGKLLEQF